MFYIKSKKYFIWLLSLVLALALMIMFISLSIKYGATTVAIVSLFVILVGGLAVEAIEVVVLVVFLVCYLIKNAIGIKNCSQ